MPSTISAGTTAGTAIAIAGDTTGNLAFQTNGTTTAMTIDTSQNVGIGTNSPPSYSSQTTLGINGTTYGRLDVMSGGTVRGSFYGGSSGSTIASSGANPLGFETNGTERMRIDSSGRLLFGTTATSPATSNSFGITLGGNTDGNYYAGVIQASSNGNPSLLLNRGSDDGTLVGFYQAAIQEGSISVSGNTVSYNAFAGSHWSQLSDGSKPEILRGTVMESINELCEWPDEPTSERLCRVKISDTAGSKKVYGVFMDWDNDWTATNDMLVTAVGAFICRINKDVVVQEGDLLESNGDGTARVQADDIMRSSTIGKVTCTEKTHQFDDGSYCVPTVLYCG